MNELEKIIEEKASSLIVKETETEFLDCVGQAINEVEEKIVQKAVLKVNDEQIIEKHAKRLAEISDEALEAETEKQELIVKDKKAQNKAEKQEIRNRLIALKTEAIKLKREKKQTLKEQKADHKKRNKDALWEIYKDKLTKMKYTYVPNRFILKMLLFMVVVKLVF